MMGFYLKRQDLDIINDHRVISLSCFGPLILFDELLIVPHFFLYHTLALILACCLSQDVMGVLGVLFCLTSSSLYHSLALILACCLSQDVMGVLGVLGVMGVLGVLFCLTSTGTSWAKLLKPDWQTSMFCGDCFVGKAVLYIEEWMKLALLQIGC